MTRKTGLNLVRLLHSSTKVMSRHPDFNKVQASRPEFERSKSFSYSKTVDTGWRPGQGATSQEWKDHKKVELDPYAEGRSSGDVYKLIISGITPRPIGFISTVSKDGVRNLAPFSYFNAMSSDPPMFALGIAGAPGNLKDSTQNILDTGEVTINIISEWFIEAANYASIDAPAGVDEWQLSGLTPAKSRLVRPDHVAESAFSIEGKLRSHNEWKSRRTGKVTSTTMMIEGLTFHIREDVLNEDRNIIDISKLRPVSRLGGITYGRTVDGYELKRPHFEKEKQTEEVEKMLNSKI